MTRVAQSTAKWELEDATAETGVDLIVFALESKSNGLIGGDQLHRQALNVASEVKLGDATSSPLRMAPPSSNLSIKKWYTLQFQSHFTELLLTDEF